MSEGAALLVDEVLPREPMRQWVLSVPFALRYLFATAPAVMGQVLGIVVYRTIANHLIKAAGMTCATAQTGAVTLTQRFGSALDLNIHFHMLFLDGVYVTTGDGLRFRRVPPPTVEALEKLVRGISERVGRTLERLGLLVRDLESSFLTPDSPDGAGFDDSVSKHPTVTAPRMSCLSRSTLSPGLPRWCRRPGSTSRVTTGYLRRTTDCVSK